MQPSYWFDRFRKFQEREAAYYISLLILAQSQRYRPVCHRTNSEVLSLVLDTTVCLVRNTWSCYCLRLEEQFMQNQSLLLCIQFCFHSAGYSLAMMMMAMKMRWWGWNTHFVCFVIVVELTLMSRWTNPLSCIYDNVGKIWRINILIWSCVNLLGFPLFLSSMHAFSKSYNVPPVIHSKTKYKSSSRSRITSVICTMFGWRKCCRLWTSRTLTIAFQDLNFRLICFIATMLPVSLCRPFITSPNVPSPSFLQYDTVWVDQLLVVPRCLLPVAFRLECTRKSIAARTMEGKGNLLEYWISTEGVKVYLPMTPSAIFVLVEQWGLCSKLASGVVVDGRWLWKTISVSSRRG